MGGAAPVEGGKKGKKALDASLNVVPFIDLLSCCISFLLITAVWTQTSRLQVSQSGGPPQEQQDEHKETLDLKLMLTDHGYALVLPGATIEIPKVAGNGEQRYDLKTLADKLKTVKTSYPEQRAITVLPEDGVNYEDLVATVDTAVGEALPDVSVSAAVN